MEVLFWKPVFACKEIETHIFKDSICKNCGHLKNEHDRIEKHWVDKEEPIPEEEKKNIESEISKLRECLNKIEVLEETQLSVKKKEEELKDKQNKFNNSTKEYDSKISQKKNLNDLIDMDKKLQSIKEELKKKKMKKIKT